MKSYKTKRAIGNIIGYIILILISIIWLFPFVGLVLQSFRSYATEYGGMVDYLVPKQFSLDNYKFLFDTSQNNYLLWYKNTIVIAVFVSIFQTIIQLCVSYALSRMRFAGRTFLMRFWLIRAIPGLILVTVASCGMGYYVCKGYFDTIPKALDEAAMIDGATRARIFFTMIIPMSKPIIIYTALVAFMAPWCDYVFASYVAFGHDTSYNVAVGMTRWVWTNDYQGYFTRFCAGGVLVAIPVTLLFMFLQKYYVEGVTGGAVKG